MKKVIKLVIFCIFIGCFVYLGTIHADESKKKKSISGTDNDKYFGSAYVFEEINHSKLLSKLNSKNQNMIIYACFKDSNLCDSYGDVINDIARIYEIDEIYYYDFKIDKKENNATYQKIVNKLSSYLITDDLGNQDLHAPTLIFIKDSEVYMVLDDLALQHGKDANDKILSLELQEEKKEELVNVMEGYLYNE